MKPLKVDVERRLRSANAARNRHVIVRRSLALALIFLALLLLFGLVLRTGWITSTLFIVVTLTLLILASLFVEFIIVVMSADADADRTRLAAAIERSCRPLMDRLNTLVYLREQSGTTEQPYVDAIEEQTVGVLRRAPDQSPFKWRSTRWLSAATVALALFTLFFYAHFRPWQAAAAAAEASQEVASLEPLEIPEWDPDGPDSADSQERQQEPWSEVRISQPGHDLHVTSLDLIPLQIQAASTHSIMSLAWFTGINGNEPQRHALPDPSDPRYVTAAAELSIPRQEAHVWDVIRYYAEATTDEPKNPRSLLYFADIIPFPDDLARLPGGLDGPAVQQLGELTALLERHEESMRQTVRATDEATLPNSDRTTRLAALEMEQDELAITARHLRARLRSRFPTASLDTLDSDLQQLERTWQTARTALHDDDLQQAVVHHRDVLGQLARVRRHFYEEVLKHPEHFAGTQTLLAEAPIDAETEEKRSSSESLKAEAKRSRDTAQRIDTLRNELEPLIAQQRAIERDLSSIPSTNGAIMAPREQSINDAMEQLEGPHAAEVQGVAPLWQEARQMLDLAAQLLPQQTAEEARPLVEQGTAAMQQISQALAEQSSIQRLQQSNSLRQQLHKNIRKYQQIAESPSDAPKTLRGKATEETKEIMRQIGDVARHYSPPPTAERAPDQSESLKEALSPDRQTALAKKCDSLNQAATPNNISKASQSISEDLNRVARAFDKFLQQAARRAETARAQRLADQLDKRQQQLADARKFVQETLQKQRGIERSMPRTPSSSLTNQATQQRRLNQDFKQFTQQHPTPFRPAEQEKQQVDSGLQKAAESMQQSPSTARTSVGQAAKSLQRLDDALGRQESMNNLVKAFQLQQQLQQQMKQLEKMKRDPSKTSSAACDKAAGQCNSIADQAGQLGQHSATPPALAQPLQKAMEGNRQQQIEQAGQELSAANKPGERQAGSQQLADSMRPIADALEQGLADALSNGSEGKPLNATGQQALERALRQLASEARQSGDRPGQLSADQRSQLRDSALQNLIEGIASLYGYNDRTRDVIQQMRRKLKEPDQPVDAVTVNELRQEIQNLRRDIDGRDEQQVEPDGRTEFDPSQLPPDFRRSIENYFRALSRQR